MANLRTIQLITAVNALALTARLAPAPQQPVSRPPANAAPVHRRHAGNKSHQIVFDIIEDRNHIFCAKCRGHHIVTYGVNCDELRANIRQAVEVFYADRNKPERIKLHIVREEILA